MGAATSMTQRTLSIRHPPVSMPAPPTGGRQALGWPLRTRAPHGRRHRLRAWTSAFHRGRSGRPGQPAGRVPGYRIHSTRSEWPLSGPDRKFLSLVSECQRITLASIDHPPSVEELSTRLRASRCARQGSFWKVAGPTPVDYLRSLRFNVARRNLQRTSLGEISIGQLA